MHAVSSNHGRELNARSHGKPARNSLPELSHDGSMIAYTVRTTNMEGDESSFTTHIWVASADGSMNRQCAFGEQYGLANLYSSPPAFGYLLSAQKVKDVYFD